jgi:8-oxo-dGTP diphosphatase
VAFVKTKYVRAFAPAKGAAVEHQRPLLAIYCLVLRGPQLLLLKRTGTKYASGFWSVPAGHVDHGEPLLAAASRELEEETGLIVAQRAWSLVAFMHRQTEQRSIIDVFLRTEEFSGDLMNREPEKHGALGFRDISELPSPVVPYVKEVLARIGPKQGGGAPFLLQYGWKELNDRVD